MGLSLPLLRFLAREHRRQPFVGSVITLGRQCVYATFEQVTGMLREEGIEPCELAAGTPRTTNIPQWRGTPNEQFTSDVVFFRLLGLTDVKALDYSGFEGAELVADLNLPVPTEWHDQCNLIVDSGTLEHVFHLPQALASIGRMLKIGGRIVHLSPANNYLNHGFYQFSPTLYADFYRANAFDNVHVFVGEERDYRRHSAPLAVYEIEQQPDLMMSQRRLLTLAVARKTPASTVDQVPLQGFYANLLKQSDSSENKLAATTWPQRLKRLIPTSLKTLVRRLVPGFDPYHRPWRLQRWGKLKGK